MEIKELAGRIGKDWTLFLDRDGVLNRRLMEDYVKTWEEWAWLPGVLKALPLLAGRFGRIVVVTNQRGIARGLMSAEDLAEIHGKMLMDVTNAGGRIDAIYHCPHDRDAGCTCRKPGIGMYHQAQADFPEIEGEKSVLVGDSRSDLEMAKAAGMVAVHIGEGEPLADYAYASLWAFTKDLGLVK